MDSPITVGKDGINIKPENMKIEKLYHCIFNEKVYLIYKDSQEILNCFEIEEQELVDKVKTCTGSNDLEKIFGDYVQNQNIKN